MVMKIALASRLVTKTIIGPGWLLLLIFAFQSCCLSAQSAAVQHQLNPVDLQKFNSGIKNKEWLQIKKAIRKETGLVPARSLSLEEKRLRQKAFDEGKAGKYTVQQLVDAEVFKFYPVANLHPKALASDDDKSIRLRNGKALEVNNSVWGKKLIRACLLYGVMHSTEDGKLGARGTIDSWNNDCAAGKRSSSTPFVVGRSLNEAEIYVTADFERRWQRHCSSALTQVEPVVNWNSIGIEMEHSSLEKLDYTETELDAVARLWTYVQQRSGIADKCIYTHAELQGHLPKEHKSFRSDPEEFNWNLYAEKILRLRKGAGYEPPAGGKRSGRKSSNSNREMPDTRFSKSLEDAAGSLE